MLYVELTFGLLVYAGIWFATTLALRLTRSGPRYVIVWSAVLATCIVWLAMLFAIHGGEILQIAAAVFRHPNEDFWGFPSVGLFFTFLLAAPTPVAVACLCAFPAGRWFTARAPRIAFLLASAILIFLHVTFRRVTILQIHDQFDQPAPDVKVTYYLDGSHTKHTGPRGELKIGCYHGMQAPHFNEAVAGGYVVDCDRVCRRSDVLSHWRNNAMKRFQGRIPLVNTFGKASLHPVDGTPLRSAFAPSHLWRFNPTCAEAFGLEGPSGSTVTFVHVPCRSRHRRQILLYKFASRESRRPR